MSKSNLLILKLVVLGGIGFLAYVVDDWAKDNRSSFFALMEGVFLVLWMSSGIGEIFKGRLKAGPDRVPKIKAIEMPVYQAILAVYLMVLAVLIFIGVTNSSIYIYTNSPFLTWLTFMPLIVVAFILEFYADSN